MLSLFLPQWSIDCLRRRRRRCAGPSAEALVVVGRTGHRQLVLACDRRASAAGVSAGQPLAQARALLAGQAYHVAPYQPAADHRGLDVLAQWAMQFSPRVQVDAHSQPGAGGLLIDITGCQRLLGDDESILVRVLAGVRRLGVTASAAVAGTIGCAWAAARFAPQDATNVPPGQERAMLCDLPAAALRLEDETVAALAEVGLRRVGQILVMPAGALRQRFGGELLLRIDQTLGRVWEAFEAAEPVTVPRVSLELAGPVRDPKVVQLGVRNLLSELLLPLAARQLGVRRLELTLLRSDLEPLVLAIRLAYPSPDGKHLWTLLRPLLERANMGFGVEGLCLAAADTGPLTYTQAVLLPEALPQQSNKQDARRFGELVDVLASRLGREGVLARRSIDSHLPERSFANQPAVEMLAQRIRPRGGGNSKGGQAQTGMDRPSVLLDHPQRIEATLLSPDGPVVGFTWNGRTHRCRMCQGPERLSPQWWGGGRAVGGVHPMATRDYFKIQDEAGRWMWIYRQLNDSRWYVHGMWE